MDLKRNIFWIVIGVVLLAGIGAYAWKISSLTKNEKSISELESACKNKVDTLTKMAAKPDTIVNPEQVKLARDFKRNVEEQSQFLEKTWKEKAFDLRYSNVPSDALAFDTWLGEQRTKLMEQCQKAGLQLPADFEKVLFKDSTTNKDAEDVTRHPDYRLRQLALMDEVLSVLCKKYGKQQVLKFQPEKESQEPREVSDVGAQALEKFIMLPSRDIAGKNAQMATSEERARITLDEALKRAAFKVTAHAAPVDLPFTITSLDIQFLSPLPAVPGILQALESSPRYTAVVTRVDYQRATSPYPMPTDLAKTPNAGGVPMLNTHYQEGPVRVLVSLDLYEFNAAKEAQQKAAAAPKEDPKKAKKKP